MKKVVGVLAGLVAIIAGVLQLVRLYDTTTLPACDASRTTKTLSSIIKDNNPGLEADTYADLKQIGSDDKMMTCSGLVTLKDGRKVALGYRTFWDGWTQKVEITDSRFQ